MIYLWVKRKRGVSQIGFFHTDAKADLAPERVREPVAEEMKEQGQIKDIQIFPPFSYGVFSAFGLERRVEEAAASALLVG